LKCLVTLEAKKKISNVPYLISDAGAAAVFLHSVYTGHLGQVINNYSKLDIKALSVVIVNTLSARSSSRHGLEKIDTLEDA